MEHFRPTLLIYIGLRTRRGPIVRRGPAEVEDLAPTLPEGRQVSIAQRRVTTPVGIHFCKTIP
jgi:hypothetical protein